MNRIKDYVWFAACFAGLGYVALLPVTAGEAGGASILCGDGGPDWLAFLCRAAQPMRLPAGLHALGFASVAFVTARALIGAVKRSRPSTALVPECEDEMPPSPRKLHQHLLDVKPRAQFGLRGIQR